MSPTLKKRLPLPGNGKRKLDKASKSKEEAARAQKRAKKSNRPTNSFSSSEDSEDDEDPAETEQDKAALLAALEAHKRAFFAEALPQSSTSSQAENKAKVKEVKSVWDMGMDDFDEEESDEEDGSEREDAEESDEEGECGEEEPEAVVASTSQRQPLVVAFHEPRLGGGDSSVSLGSGSQKDMSSFMSSKVKNSRPTVSVADLVNVKPFSTKKKNIVKPETEEEKAEEAHLSTLDSHLSALLKPLVTDNGTASLPSLLSSLPLAPTKALKGHTPLPSNAPRTLRKGQNAANLSRAQRRDAINGLVKKGEREATTLKERRKDRGEEGEDRHRGMRGGVGRLVGGELKIRKKDVERIQRMGMPKADGGKKKKGGGGRRRG
ncbi:hypothetical protein T439DRAFT_380050 [Meredithblackwellia eburnea MCA 4105]